MCTLGLVEVDLNSDKTGGWGLYVLRVLMALNNALFQMWRSFCFLVEQLEVKLNRIVVLLFISSYYYTVYSNQWFLSFLLLILIYFQKLLSVLTFFSLK